MHLRDGSGEIHRKASKEMKRPLSLMNGMVAPIISLLETELNTLVP